MTLPSKQLIVARIDRFGRLLSENIEEVERLGKLGIELCDVEGRAVNLTSPSGWLAFVTESVSAHHFILRHSANVKKGKENAKHEGRPLCSTPCYGYRRKPDGRGIEPDPEKWEMAKGMVECFFEAGSLLVATELIYERYGVKWHNTGLQKWLYNVTLLGHTPYRTKRGNREPKEIKYNTHEPLLTRAQAQKVRGIIAENKRRWGVNRRHPTHPLSGLVVCPNCGRHMAIKRCVKKYNTYNYLNCLGRRHNKCDNAGSTRAEYIEAAVQKALSDRAADIARWTLKPAVEVEHPRAAKLRAELSQLRAINNPRNGVLLAIEEIETELESLKFEAAEWQLDQQEHLEMLEGLSDPDVWGYMEPDYRRELYKHLIKKVHVYKKKVVDVVLTV